MEVPFLANLHLTRHELSLNPEERSEGSMRAAWKEYTQQLLPHAFRQVRNFMLASMSEGRNCEDLEEGLIRGKPVRCRLNNILYKLLFPAYPFHYKLFPAYPFWVFGLSRV